jgi:hypothetical protein
MIGIEYLNRIVDERIAHPSMAHTLGLRLTEVGEAGPSSPARPAPTAQSPWFDTWLLGATLLDSCMTFKA